MLTDFQRLNGFGVMWGPFELSTVAATLARTAPFTGTYVAASDMEGEALTLIEEAIAAGRVEAVSDGQWIGIAGREQDAMPGANPAGEDHE